MITFISFLLPLHFFVFSTLYIIYSLIIYTYFHDIELSEGYCFYHISLLFHEKIEKTFRLYSKLCVLLHFKSIKMIPRYLCHGDCIGLVAPARKIEENEILPAVDFFQKNGFRVKLGQHIFASDHQFAGTDEQRAADFQSFLDDPDVNAILCARGGYGSVRLIDQLDFTRFLQNPKWICGFSDVTVFHSHLHHLNVATLHCTMPINMQADSLNHRNAQTMLQALTGNKIEYHIPTTDLNRNGCAEGTLVGGNLSILYSLMGSASAINTDNKILFIEDLDEYLYHIDRMMICLKRAGMLDKLAGLIVGGMSEMNDNTIPFGKTGNEIVASHCREYHFPVCFNFPAGHMADNVALKLGTHISLSVNTDYTTISFN